MLVILKTFKNYFISAEKHQIEQKKPQKYFQGFYFLFLSLYFLFLLIDKNIIITTDCFFFAIKPHMTGC